MIVPGLFHVGCMASSMPYIPGESIIENTFCWWLGAVGATATSLSRPLIAGRTYSALPASPKRSHGVTMPRGFSVFLPVAVIRIAKTRGWRLLTSLWNTS